MWGLHWESFEAFALRGVPEREVLRAPDDERGRAGSRANAGPILGEAPLATAQSLLVQPCGRSADKGFSRLRGAASQDLVHSSVLI